MSRATGLSCWNPLTMRRRWTSRRGWCGRPSRRERGRFGQKAASICAKKTVGGKKGWRLPAVKELATLADHNIYPPPALPTGHPFSNIEFFGYWTATEHEDYTMVAWDVNFDYGIVGSDFKQNTNFVWCVRDNEK